jgi:hypothetical protein
MRSLLRAAATPCAMLALSACAATAHPDSPAVFANPGPATHAELVKVVSGALNVQSVTIADDALTRESLLVIERHPARDTTGQRLNGRETDPPEQFRLMTDDRGRCTLVHLGTDRRYSLAAQCKNE